MACRCVTSDGLVMISVSVQNQQRRAAVTSCDLLSSAYSDSLYFAKKI